VLHVVLPLMRGYPRRDVAFMNDKPRREQMW
jgi:hypothetical protein